MNERAGPWGVRLRLLHVETSRQLFSNRPPPAGQSSHPVPEGILIAGSIARSSYFRDYVKVTLLETRPPPPHVPSHSRAPLSNPTNLSILFALLAHRLSFRRWRNECRVIHGGLGEKEEFGRKRERGDGWEKRGGSPRRFPRAMCRRTKGRKSIGGLEPHVSRQTALSHVRRSFRSQQICLSARYRSISSLCPCGISREERAVTFDSRERNRTTADKVCVRVCAREA